LLPFSGETFRCAGRIYSRYSQIMLHFCDAGL
jgi:hypothetical protein